ncbi:hypothetical protein GR183_17260 [Stappia sp. GBMRC 2046]|uniref:Uncharacterized protein n=1 Tax=Stappia sediminis TaxID=2692190 RepID=A0A7X3LX34_9HYPH|nr:hypothetical protein [Stappia sediminis]MXN66668.1 hypothetical protein [Stappia sediminis]
MYQPGVTEAIWHFAGYLHLADELARARIAYEEFLREQYIAAEKFGVDPELTSIAPVTFEGMGANATHVDLSHTKDTSYDIRIRFKHDANVPEADIGHPVQGDQVQQFIANLYFAPGVIEPNYYLIRFEGGDQKWIEIHQTNHMHTNNYVNVVWESGIADLHDVDVEASLASMMELAEAAFPEAYMPDGATGAEILDFFVNHQEEIASSGEAPPQVVQGVYVNGVLQAEGTEVKLDLFDDDGHREGAPPLMPRALADDDEEDESEDASLADAGAIEPAEAEYEGPFQAAAVGGKIADNTAVIVDANEACGTMVVMGNWHVTNAIFQLNIYSDNDHVSVAGAGNGFGPLVEAGGNVAMNRAELADRALFDDEIDNRGMTGFNWEIETVHGDFYDIKTLFQENYVCSTDITVQSMSTANYSLMVDHTGQYNLISLSDLGSSYDLIVVLGDYHSANYIKQMNFIEDSDYVMSASMAENGGGGQSVYTGQNYLLNTASIYSYRDGEYQEVTDELESFLDDVENANYIQPETWWEISGAGSTTMNVLYVTGDYYDINYICQKNVIADVDTAVQMFSPGGGAGGQYLSTGANTAENYASIYDFGAYGDQFLGGEMYEDSMLVQTNIVAGDDDDIEYGDVDQLASELVAFVDTSGGGSGDDDGGGFMSGAEIANGGDMLGGVMT